MFRFLPRFSASSRLAGARPPLAALVKALVKALVTALALSAAVLAAAPAASAQPGRQPASYAPAAPAGVVRASLPDRFGLAVRVSTYSVIPALASGPYVDGLTGLGVVMRVRFVSWLSGEVSFDSLSGSNLGLSRTSRPLVASIVAELRPFEIFSPYLTAGAGVMWSSYRGGAFGGGSQREGLAQIGAGLRIRLYRGLVAGLEARAIFSGTDGDACESATQCSSRSSGDAYGLQLSFTLGVHF